MVTRHLLTGASALAILATATPSFAQQTPNTSVGANNTRDITSTGGGAGNTNTTNCTQNGNNNSCTITQRDGSNNSSSITQTGDNNRALNEQTGSNNGSSITQDSQFTTGTTVSNPPTSTTAGGNSASVIQLSSRSNTSTATSSQNTSTVSQTGQNNSLTLRQTNGNAGTDTLTNTSSVTQVSTAATAGAAASANAGNFASVIQDVGAFSTAGGITAGQNQTISQNGRGNSATVDQRRGRNVATVNQGVAGSDVRNQRASVGQFAIGSSVTITQRTTANVLGSTDTTATGGRQGNEANVNVGDANNDTRGAQATVSQESNGDLANVFVFGGTELTSSFTPAGATAPTATGNNFNGSNVTQRNTTVTLAGGTPTTPATTPAGGTASNFTNTGTQAELNDSNNEVFVSIARGSQQTSTIDQNGVGNFADVTLTSGVAGFDPGNASQTNDPTRGRSGGNTSTVNQSGRGNAAVVVIGSGRNASVQGFGNQVTINQTSSANGFAGRGDAQPRSQQTQSEGRFAVVEPTEFSAGTARGNFAQTFQFGRFATATVTQVDGRDSGTRNADGTISRARADISQAGERFSASLTQTGDNFASITQGQLAIGTNGTVTLTQTDAGNGAATSGGQTDQFGNPVAGGTVRQFNVATISQFGDTNVVTANQNTRDGFMSVFQAVNTTGNAVDADQGGGRAGAPVGPDATVTGTSRGRATPRTAETGIDSVSLTANISQTGSGNGARVDQDGQNNVATVDQRGNGTGTNTGTGTGGTGTVASGGSAGTSSTVANGTNAGNFVLLQQAGRNNRGRVFQGTGVGRSGDTATGASPSFTGQTAEARLIQTGDNNSGTIEQNGRGQRAALTQAGDNNTGSIIQDAAATNASATLTQNGFQNTFFIRQTAANQQITVTQNGAGNTATTVNSSGAGGGSNGFTPQ